jgi:hypothetical protein
VLSQSLINYFPPSFRHEDHVVLTLPLRVT